LVRLKGVFHGVRTAEGLSGATIVAMIAIAVMMILGGPIPGMVVTILIGLAGLGLLAALPFANGGAGVKEQPLLLRCGLLGLAILPLLQLVPLPPSIWHALPGQELRIETLSLVGLADSWQPLSLTPAYTAGAAVIGIGFVALIMLLLALPERAIRRIAWFVMAIVAANIVIGLFQVASGGRILQFYDASDHGALIGFYANKNHAAMVLAASMPIMAYLLGNRAHPEGTRTWLGLYIGIILVAIVTTNSRAGIGLGLLTALLLGICYIRAVKPIYVVGIAAFGIIALLFVSQSHAFEQLFTRFNAVDDDLRWQFLWSSKPLIDTYWIYGSGIGSFSTLYAAHESLSLVKPTIVNQLHNDYVQIVMETGLIGTFVLLVLLAGLIWRGVSIWRLSVRERRLPVFFGVLMLAVVALHSGVDYPLRRPAVLPILALAVILVIRGDLSASTGLMRRKRA
jgi:O-antigen ligase